MLVLTRTAGESVQIGDDIIVTILENKHGKSRVGITAPRDVKIMRTELLENSHPAATSEES